MSCSCSLHSDLFVVRAGEGIGIEGTGTPTSPYVIRSLASDFSNFFRVQDTPTVDLNYTGTGTDGDPIVLSANSTLTLVGLADVADPGGSPAVGESPVWVGVGSAGHWEFQIPPVSPAGATNVENGLSGTGAPATPVRLETSGVWGSGTLAGLGADSTIGDAVYIDSAGKVRSKPSTAVEWTAVSNKPTEFPPASHSHTVADISDLSTNGNSAKTNGIKFSSTPTSVTPPSSPTTGDIWFFPKGS